MENIKRTVINIERATVSPQWQYVATINILPAQCCFNIANMYAQYRFEQRWYFDWRSICINISWKTDNHSTLLLAHLHVSKVCRCTTLIALPLSPDKGPVNIYRGKLDRCISNSLLNKSAYPILQKHKKLLSYIKSDIKM